MPTLSNVGFGFLLPNGSNDLVSNFFYWHYPKQTFSFCHSCINKTCKRIRDACIYPYKINVAQYYP